MRFGSVCSGIEAASVAWEPLGWEPQFFAEVEKFPSAVLAHHYPTVPNRGDMTKFKDWPNESIDLLVGGTPCQAFSVAGLRGGLADARGNLALTFCELADHYDPEWVLWENVPGVLSSTDNAFGCFLAGLCGASEPLVPGRKWSNAGVVSGPKRTVAWRTLDAQFFGLAQRRRRVFVLAVRGAGNWASAAALFPVGEGVFWNSAPSRKAREVAPTIPARSLGGGGLGTDFDCDGGVIAMAHGQGGAEIGFDRGPTLTCNHEAPIIAHALRGEGFDASEHGTGRGTPLVAVACTGDGITADPISASEAKTYTHEGTTFRLHNCVQTAVAFGGDITRTLQARHDSSPCADRVMDVVASAMQVRRLTPVECERLQGFPDNWTLIHWRGAESSDGPRYKALGNSMAVPCMRWIGERIQMVGQIQRAAA